MNKITFTQGECKEETTSTWLVAIIQFGLKIDFFKPFESYRLKMKKVKYSVNQKLLVIVMSIIMGCEFMKDINEKLGSEKLSANIIGMDTFPDQSQINKVLTRMDEESITQFQEIHSLLFCQHSNSIYSEEEIVVDFDQSGLIANGKSYEFSSKGYFSKKKNQSGYQMSAAFTGEHSETVAMYLDSGNTHCQEHFKDLLDTTVLKFKESLRNGNLIIRTDSGYGSSDKIEDMLGIPNLKFITKGYSTPKAKNLAKGIPYENYTKVAKAAWIYELPANGGLRTIIVQILTNSGKLKYTMLVTNIPSTRMDASELFHFYNKRQTIEAFFKMAKNVYHIKNLRTTRFYGAYGFLWLVFITHNLITWFRETALAETNLKDIGVGDLVKKVGRIRGHVTRINENLKVNIPPLTKLSRLIAEALCYPRYIQLSFETLRC